MQRRAPPPVPPRSTRMQRMERISPLRFHRRAVLGPLLLVGFGVTCRDQMPTAPPPSIDAPRPTMSASASATAASEVFVGAGDIATCSSDRDEATAALLDGIAGTVFTV